MSSGYPSTIHPADRRWIIEGKIGEYIILEFVDLDIWHEDENAIVPCSNNYVTVDDVTLNGQRTEQGRFCSASTTREKIQSSWHMMELRYLIETSEGGTGFMAKYTIIDFVMEAQEEGENGRCILVLRESLHIDSFTSVISIRNSNIKFWNLGFRPVKFIRRFLIHLYFNYSILIFQFCW